MFHIVMENAFLIGKLFKFDAIRIPFARKEKQNRKANDKQDAYAHRGETNATFFHGESSPSIPNK